MLKRSVIGMKECVFEAPRRKYHVYMLLLKSLPIYVGCSVNPDVRYLAHRSGCTTTLRRIFTEEQCAEFVLSKVYETRSIRVATHVERAIRIALQTAGHTIYGGDGRYHDWHDAKYIKEK